MNTSKDNLFNPHNNVSLKENINQNKDLYRTPNNMIIGDLSKYYYKNK